MRSALKKQGLSVFFCISSFFALWHCVEKSSCCDNVLDDDVLTWGGWVERDRGAEVTRSAQLRAPRGGRTGLRLLMHPCLGTLSLPWGTLSLGRVYAGFGPVGGCCSMLAAKSSKEPVSQPSSVKHSPVVSTKCSLGQPPSFLGMVGMNMDLNSVERWLLEVKELAYTHTSTSLIVSVQISLDWFRMWLYSFTLLYV